MEMLLIAAYAIRKRVGAEIEINEADMSTCFGFINRDGSYSKFIGPKGTDYFERLDEIIRKMVIKGWIEQGSAKGFYIITQKGMDYVEKSLPKSPAEKTVEVEEV